MLAQYAILVQGLNSADAFLDFLPPGTSAVREYYLRGGRAGRDSLE